MTIRVREVGKLYHAVNHQGVAGKHYTKRFKVGSRLINIHDTQGGRHPRSRQDSGTGRCSIKPQGNAWCRHLKLTPTHVG